MYDNTLCQSPHFQDYPAYIDNVALHSFPTNETRVELQGDQFNMAMFFLYLVKSDLSSVHVYISIHWTRNFYKVPEKHGYV